MPRGPSKITFSCESCRHAASVRQVRRWMGQCYRCQGKSWTLEVQYRETEVNTSAAGLLSFFVFGLGRRTTATHLSRASARGVTDEDARRLVETRSQVARRVTEFIRDREQDALRKQGARNCPQCDAVFMPGWDKPWTLQGYCSKSCAAQGGASSPTSASPLARDAGRSKSGRILRVICPRGHEFDVPATFSGCQRPCPGCGEKTTVP